VRAPTTVEARTDVPRATDKTERFQNEILIHVDALFRAALRLTDQVPDAEDLVQETCLRAFKSLDQLRHPAAAKVWLFTILRSVYLRQEERKPPWLPIVNVEDLAGSFLNPKEAPQTDAYRRSIPPEQLRREEIREAVLKLPLVYREAIVLAHVAGFSYREMAQILDVPPGTVMSRLFRGRRLLRAFFRANSNRPEKTS
jgi:RNA polymerase sigma-70 factor (ECF subfamily)